MKLLLILLFLYISSCTKICQNNGVYQLENDLCICSPNYIGANCNISAYELQKNQIKIPINQNFTFTYMKPASKQFYRFAITFCLDNPKQQVDFIIYTQQEKENGQIFIEPPQDAQIIYIKMGFPTTCLKIFSTVLVPSEQKSNGQIPKIVFGFMNLKGKNTSVTQNVKNDNEKYIKIQIQTDLLFSMGYLITIVMSFFGISLIIAILSAAFVAKRRRAVSARPFRPSVNRLETINKIMPLSTFSMLNQQSNEQNQSTNEQTCAICLCDFQPHQIIRKTPCSHIYHQSCLNSWIINQFNCPVCRSNFEQLNEQEINIQLRDTNVRELIL